MKKFVLLLLAFVMCLTFVACGEESDSGSKSDSKNKNNDKESVSTEETITVPIAVDKTPVIVAGEKNVTDICEFTVDYVKITADVVPPTPDDWYSHYEADDGKVYVDFCVAYKNTDTTNIGADETVTGKLYYNGKYEYTGFSMIEEGNRSDFTYSNITSIAPLSTEYVHYLFSVPKEVETSGAEIYLEMNIGGEDFKIIVREGSSFVPEESNAQTDKKMGTVAQGEVVATENAEFNVDYSNITNDVVPKKPDDFYSHYEADSGKVYVDICFAYKNTSSSSISADDVFSAKLKYAEKYEYTGFSMIEENSRSDFTYTNITSVAPLTTEYIHYLFEVPEEVKTSTDSVVVTFTIDGNTYTYNVR